MGLLSIAGAEYIFLSEDYTEVQGMLSVLSELNIIMSNIAKLHVDNTEPITRAGNALEIRKGKHINIFYHSQKIILPMKLSNRSI